MSNKPQRSVLCNSTKKLPFFRKAPPGKTQETKKWVGVGLLEILDIRATNCKIPAAKTVENHERHDKICQKRNYMEERTNVLNFLCNQPNLAARFWQKRAKTPEIFGRPQDIPPFLSNRFAGIPYIWVPIFWKKKGPGRRTRVLFVMT